MRDCPLPDQAALSAARARQEVLTKPQGALGRLEDLACWLAARQQRAIPESLRPAITVFAADHGVVQRGVSAYPSNVTAQMVGNFARGGAAINVLARRLNARLTVVDVGVASPVANERIVNAKVRSGTADLSTEPAMTRLEAERALGVGGDFAATDAVHGNLLIAGDMGIGNTTASACLICALTGAAPGDIVGHGTGLNETAREHKVQVVQTALARARSRTPADGIDWLAEVGGLEIAAMVGYYLEAARRGVPILLDGFVSAAAALVARCIAPRVAEWMLAGHLSAERGHRAALHSLGLTPLIDLDMRLGEGSGAAIAVPLLQAAVALHAEMATFGEAGVSGPSA